ncbi:hypothetical protein DCAR_0727601 [Daucus carota subsp. sativus]|uniref:Uncharacterized protein n=2 Tax=Daucus carota subsp. sativus TaxID=79200 RepID=A0AAF1B696_DAUCS|nr:PREDICTED: uncharacterized protein LOC108193534 [Daucus carota subsp. sativus]WOH08164.1 hypothetical protein DCAR_0727601 [Daucus carota subsp. sativus]
MWAGPGECPPNYSLQLSHLSRSGFSLALLLPGTMAQKDVMELAVNKNTKETRSVRILAGFSSQPFLLRSVRFTLTPVCVSTLRSHLTRMPVIQDEHEKCNSWLTSCELVNRVALGIASVPGYIWKILGLSTAHGDIRQIGDDPNIIIPGNNLEVPDPDVGWERN